VRNVYRVLDGNLIKGDYLGNLSVDVKMPSDRLKQIWDGFDWV
jgi:hypothetical protein